MRAFQIAFLFIALCAPAFAQDTAKQKRELQQFYTRLTALEASTAALKRHDKTGDARADAAAYARSEAQVKAVVNVESALMADLKKWAGPNMGPGKTTPEVGNLYNELVRLVETYGVWASARDTWVMAGQALDLKAMVAREAQLYQDYGAKRDAWVALSKK